MSIFYNCSLKNYIYIKIIIFSYIISLIFNQINFKDLNQWYLIINNLYIIISVKIGYKNYNNELVAIVKVFQI